MWIWRLLIGQYTVYTSRDAASWTEHYSYTRWQLKRGLKWVKALSDKPRCPVFIQVVDRRTGKSIFFSLRDPHIYSFIEGGKKIVWETQPMCGGRQ